jgi:heme-degrading monooxygenase HmoA
MGGLWIDCATSVTTVISTFTVDPSRQSELLHMLSSGTAWLNDLPGFIGAAFHASLDGTRVVIYTQWSAPGAVHLMLANPTMGDHHAEVTSIASVEVARFVVDTVRLGAS